MLDYGALYKQKKVEQEEAFTRKQTFKPNLEKSLESLKATSSGVWNPDTGLSTQQNATDNELYLKYGTSTEKEKLEEDRKFFDSEASIHHTNSILYNSGIKEPSKKMQKIQEDYDKNHPFYPSINRTSKTIVESKSNGSM